MPIYKYVCEDCGKSIEKLQTLSAEPVTHCDKCGKDNMRRSYDSNVVFREAGHLINKGKNSAIYKDLNIKKKDYFHAKA